MKNKLNICIQNHKNKDNPELGHSELLSVLRPSSADVDRGTTLLNAPESAVF